MIMVEGDVVIPASAGSFTDANVYVFLEDVSFQDVPSTVIARQVLPNVSHEAGQEKRVPFQLTTEQIDPEANYNVRVRVDLSGSSETQRGDYITTQSYPVITFDHPRRVEVHVHEVQ